MICTIVGARPNFIKVDPLLKQEIIHTGQHYDYAMSEEFFEELDIPAPEVNLGCKNNLGGMLTKLKKEIKKRKPTLVIVFGDTMSSLAGALAAAYLKIKVVHIEAGLRSYTDMPEELNRVLIDRIAKVKICPSLYAQNNLYKEGIKDDVYVVGDPSFETMGRFTPIMDRENHKQYIYFTCHRDFNADNKERLGSIFEALRESGEKIIFSAHPRTYKNLRRFRIALPSNVQIYEPQTYRESLSFTSSAKKVITDSGGVQREAFWMNVPVIILRKETEWIDIVNKGAGVLVDADKNKILEAIKSFSGSLNSPPEKGVNSRIREIIYRYV